MPYDPDFEALLNFYQTSLSPEWWRNSTVLFLHYCDLREHAQNIAFPKKVVSPSPIAKNWWKKICKHLTKISDPLAWFQHTNRSIVPFLAIVMLIFISWFAFYLVCLFQAIGVSFTSASRQAYSIWDYGINAILIVSLCVFPIAYFRWGTFLLDRKYSVRFRLLYSAGIFAGNVLFSAWEFSQLSFFPVDSMLNDSGKLSWLLAALIVFQIPTISFGMILVWDLCSLGIIQYRNLQNFLSDFHNPFPLALIAQILSGPIKSRGKTWHLSDLLPDELKAIQHWAEANRSSSEKRIAPALFIVAIIGLFVNTQFFNGIFQKVIDFLSGLTGSVLGKNNIGAALSLESILAGCVIIIFGLALVGQLYSLFGKIFRNIVVQSLIVEACIVAEYGSRTACKERKNECKVIPHKLSLWERIFGTRKI